MDHEDLDKSIKQFRIASRELFNDLFRVSDPYEADSNAWVLEERFREIQNLLFQKLVLEPHEMPEIKYGDAQLDIAVELHICEVTKIMLNREINSGYWDYPINEVTREAKLVFLNFFDWDQLDYRDNQYVRVQVSDWPSHPDAIGKHALIESQCVRFTRRRHTEDPKLSC